MNSERPVTRKIVQTALFIALAVVVRNFSTMIYLAGVPGMRIGFSGIFSRMPALLFGPFYGGLSSGILDVIGYFMNPEGGYMPLLTLTAVLGGVLSGLLWRLFRNVSNEKIQRWLWIIFIVIGAAGVFNYINNTLFPQSYIALAIAKAGKNKGFLDFGLIGVSLVGVLLLILDYALRRKFPNASLNKYYLKILLAFGVSGITVTVINTPILMHFFGLGKAGFILFLIPRLVQEILMTVILGYITSFLYEIYNRFISRTNI